MIKQAENSLETRHKIQPFERQFTSLCVKFDIAQQQQ